MGIILFDWKSLLKRIFILSHSLSYTCLFDGHLTGPTSYPHFDQSVHLTEEEFKNKQTTQSRCFSSTYLFDGYLTRTAFLRILKS